MPRLSASRPLRQLAALLALALPAPLLASYADRDDARSFIAEVAARHDFDPAELHDALGRARHDASVIRLITPPARRGARSWQNYRSRFLDRTRIEGGLAFWREHEHELARAERSFGVPAEVIVAIIGVETVYGRQTGNFETLSALATLAFDYPPRAELFRRELESLFVLARQQGRAPDSFTGSFAGALGYPQFLPSSVLAYAVDFDGNGRIDFESDAIDAIGSVANYLKVHGWQTGAPVAERARLAPTTDAAMLVAAGIEPALDPATLSAAGVSTLDGGSAAATATLVDLETPGADTEYWFGYRNFYVITRYNRSSFYAMSVYELAEALRLRRLVDEVRAQRR
ncbi:MULTISPECIES: lytic murein transglycosylase B [unclassified Thauera]|uniref:lytic murein transglycosylase B n=1 Tax=unclassified Thauera TaxID=2609274 RepID=UPI0002D0C7B0|nr:MULTISPECIES: lytic murein transglycosylase B [unclassified Thauera]ENO82930.1 lytic murein transglycosylase B [Thauera sp. 27]WBL65714.1 lytic murein transglycosylase B [Thauera sp. WB-2]HAG75834.1 lytic murein transglycosylase B [Thauera sp.]HAY10214.1 lytic murein transglycosylase B [Thauera sp.]HNR60805.1 lytic murein transglycosylase B [Thauera sp.]